MKATHVPVFSLVNETAPADPAVAQRHFAARLAVETDPSDVEADLGKGVPLVVVDARRRDSYEQEHVPGAISLPYRTISPETTSSFPKGVTVVVYCAGVYCNASTKAAVRLAALGFPVKEMIGGLDGWKVEGFPTRSGALP